MDWNSEKPLSNHYFVTKINEHTFLLENVLTHQIWNVEILPTDAVKHVRYVGDASSFLH